MVQSCTEALNQCLQVANFAQSAISQCTTLAEHLPKTEVHSESHIAHATAVFSELALGISSASLADPLAWRNAIGPIRKDHPDIIKRTNFLVEAKHRGPISYMINWLLEARISDFLIGRILVIYIIPSTCWILSIWVLLGISFPEILRNHSIDLSEKYFYWASFVAFLFSFASVYFTKKQLDISGGVNKRLEEVNKDLEIKL